MAAAAAASSAGSSVSSVYDVSEEKTNGTRLARLLIDGGTDVLRKFLHSIYPPTTLQCVLNNNFRRLQSLKLRRVIFNDQWEKLFPSSGDPPDSETFDITLLHLLLRELCHLTAPSTGWHKMPADSDASPEANVIRIKCFRNELCHSVSTGIPKSEFEDKWNKISHSLVALGLDQQEINNLKTKTNYDGTERRVDEEVQKWKLDFEPRFQALEQKMEKLNEHIQTVPRDQSGINRLETELIDHNTERHVQKEVNKWKLEFESRVEDVEQRLDISDQRQAKLEQRQDNFDERISTIEEKLPKEASHELFNCLPDDVPNVYGRSQETGEVVKAIQSRNKAVVLITGGPGFGKTTVAKGNQRSKMFSALAGESNFSVPIQQTEDFGDFDRQEPRSPMPRAGRSGHFQSGEQKLAVRPGTQPKVGPGIGMASTSQVMPEREDPLSPAATLKVTLLADEWASSSGGLSTLNRELAIHLAEQPKVEATFLVPEGACTDVHMKAAQRYGITVVEAKKRPGYDRLDWLSFPPEDLRMDIVIGHGMKLGRQGQVLKDPRSYNCKWVQVVHTAPEQLGMFKSHSGAISKGGKKHQTEVDLGKLADLVVPIGPKLAEAYSSYLRSKKDQDILTLTPGLFREFAGLKRNANENSEFKVLLCGRGDAEDFELKGYDIAAKAFADQELKGQPYRLLFVGAPDGKEDEVAGKLLNCGIAEEQLTVRKFVESREKIKDLFCEVDLAIMPSRTEGFGLIALEALSAGLPILVSSNSGFARALRILQFDKLCVVHSKQPKDWAKAIKAAHARHGQQLQEIRMLRDAYGKKFSWEKQCEALVEKMCNMVHGTATPVQH